MSTMRGINPYYVLILLYAALVPLEQIYPILGLQNSIWKPYRVVGALVIVLIFLRGRIWFDRFDRRLFLLYLIGALISVFYALFLGGSLNQTIWFLTIIAIPAGVYVATKSWIWDRNQVDTIFMVWTVVNVASVVYSINNPGEYFRITGFFESPGLFSLSLSVSVLYLFTKAMGTGTSPMRFLAVLAYVGVALFLLGGMFASGTRASLLGVFGSIVLTIAALVVTKRRSYVFNSARVLAILVSVGVIASFSFGQLRFSDRLLAVRCCGGGRERGTG